MRQSGRTFRALLKALLAASEGQKVIFITHKNWYAQTLLKQAKDVSVGVAKQVDRYRLEIEGGGSVLFKSAEYVDSPSSRPYKDYNIIRDHYWEGL